MDGVASAKLKYARDSEHAVDADHTASAAEQIAALPGEGREGDAEREHAGADERSTAAGVPWLASERRAPRTKMRRRRST